MHVFASVADMLLLEKWSTITFCTCVILVFASSAHSITGVRCVVFLLVPFSCSPNRATDAPTLPNYLPAFFCNRESNHMHQIAIEIHVLTRVRNYSPILIPLSHYVPPPLTRSHWRFLFQEMSDFRSQDSREMRFVS